MVSLIDIYNIKESTFSELKKDRDPARGDKGKTDKKDFFSKQLELNKRKTLLYYPHIIEFYKMGICPFFFGVIKNA